MRIRPSEHQHADRLKVLMCRISKLDVPMRVDAKAHVMDHVGWWQCRTAAPAIQPQQCTLFIKPDKRRAIALAELFEVV
jgi:hypothetical protein